MITIVDKADCCGCSACASVCANGHIDMQADEEGFLYPAADNIECGDCGICDRVCPVSKVNGDEAFQQKAYVVNNKDETVRRESTSGGAFTPIAQYIIEQRGIVFGAAFNEELGVAHTYIDKVKDIQKFRGSKYVQSDMGNCYKAAKEFLDNARVVCFSGTPCQIEGLKCYLRKEYENLFTVDLVCRAVPSPLVWNKYLAYLKDRLNSSEVVSVSFRDKSKYGYQYPNLLVKTDSKQYHSGVEADPYMRSFFEGVAVRPSCYQCRFKKRYRVSDFTIWDCFFSEKFDPKLDDNKGSTCVLIHTEKGSVLFDEIKGSFYFKEVGPDEIVKGMREMFHGVPHNSKRELFFNDLNVLSGKELFDKHFHSSLKSKAKRYIKIALAKTNLYKRIKKIKK